MTDYRIENDLIGEMQIPADALYGIYTVRAVNNFPVSGNTVRPELIHAYGAVKLAAARCNNRLGYIASDIFGAVQSACMEMFEGKLDAHILVDALQGGAGTSTNMNVNEVIANRALRILNKPLGDYSTIDPLEVINLHQSTNDTYPTALKVAANSMLPVLEDTIVKLQASCQNKENEFADVVKIARTQLQDAVLTTLGRQFSAYAEAFGRDRWRLYKCQERLRVVNLGGTAIGTGIGAPREYIFGVVEELKNITGLNIARSENMVDTTQNTDVFVEVSGMLKALATSLLKAATDLRLLSSGPTAGFAEITLPPMQAGSSIMPGKVNPVIPEAVAQAAITIIANDAAITQACYTGNLELNQFLPLIADKFLESINLATNACDIFARLCIDGIQVNQDNCASTVENSTAIVTALIEELGYKRAQQLAQQSTQQNKTIRQLAIEQELITEERFDTIISAENVTKLGFKKTGPSNEKSS